MNARRLGERAEHLAAGYLEGRGWTVLDRNFRDGPRELDLVVRRGDVLAFVEVKARRGAGWGHPLESITPRKQREVETAARAWLRLHRPGALLIRFDAFAIVWDGSGEPRLEHIPDAWRPGWR